MHVYVFAVFSASIYFDSEREKTISETSAPTIITISAHQHTHKINEIT